MINLEIIYIYIRESIARVWNGANAPIVHMILQPSKLANTRVVRYCHAISGPGQKCFGAGQGVASLRKVHVHILNEVSGSYDLLVGR